MLSEAGGAQLRQAGWHWHMQRRHVPPSTACCSRQWQARCCMPPLPWDTSTRGRPSGGWGESGRLALMAGCGSRMTAVRCGADTVGGSGAASHSCGPSPHPATPALQVELPGAGRAAVLRRVWSTGHLRFLPGAGPARAGVLRRACAGLCACRWSCTGTLCRRAAAPRGCPRRCRSPRPCPPLPMHSHPPPRTGTGTGTGDAEPHDPGAGGPSGHHHHSHPLLRTLPPGWRAAGVLQGLPWGCAGGAQGTAGARLACLPMCQQGGTPAGPAGQGHGRR